MGAGESAREVARQTAAAAEALQKKADHAANKSASFTAGADGEELVGHSLAPLAAQGWLGLSDRQVPHGGNLDHLVVGPPGVAVVDAKNWSYAVSAKDDGIFTGRFSRTKSLDGVLEQVELVEGALANSPYPIAVHGFLALAGELDRNRNEESIRGVRIVGSERLAEALAQGTRLLSTAQIEDVFHRLSIAFPPLALAANTSEPEVRREGGAPIEGHKLFERNTRFFYIHSWHGGGKYRLYAKSPDGADLGWKNVNTGTVEVTCEGIDAKLLRAVLDAASPTGVTIAAKDIPRIALDIPAGRLLQQIAKVTALVLIGQEWKSRGAHRLYGTLIEPGRGAFPLGHVDLRSGEIHPSVNGPLSKDLGTADVYLQHLVQRRPT